MKVNPEQQKDTPTVIDTLTKYIQHADSTLGLGILVSAHLLTTTETQQGDQKILNTTSTSWKLTFINVTVLARLRGVESTSMGGRGIMSSAAVGLGLKVWLFVAL